MEALAEIEPFHVVTLVTRAIELQSQGRDIVNMVIGEPDFPTPPAVVRAGIEALRHSKIRYTPSLGSTDLRGKLRGLFRKEARLTVSLRSERKGDAGRYKHLVGFEERGVHRLKGIPDEWQVYAAA